MFSMDYTKQLWSDSKLSQLLTAQKSAGSNVINQALSISHCSLLHPLSPSDRKVTKKNHPLFLSFKAQVII